jgi:arylsulfatase A-like enzyme
MVQPGNILWVVTTQWRAQATGYAGDRNARTPHLDQLAATSVNYPHAVTPHPFGPFARAAMLTGVPSPQNGVSDYFDPLPITTRTVAHDLAERGYNTAYFGKWHLAPRDATVPLVGEAHARTIVPEERRGGFRFWEGFEGGFLLNDPWLHGTRWTEPRKFTGYQSDVVCRHAVDWMGEQSKKQPWFAVISLESPHPPYSASAAGIAARAESTVQLRPNVPRGGDVESRARRELAGYYAHIEATDRAVGEMLLRLPPSCCVIFTSVHGDMHGSHGLFRKGWPFEESIRVPMLIRTTGPRDTSGQVNNSLASLVDLRAFTVATAEGRDAAFSAERAFISMPSVVALPDQCDRRWRGVRTAARKLILNSDGTPWLFYDLERDPLESDNLVNEPARAFEMETLRAVIDKADATVD